MPSPVHLAANQPADRFYRGGTRIRSFRSQAAEGDRVPEDWVGSTTTLFGEKGAGLSRLPDGTLLVNEVAANPGAWLGADHLRVFGADTMLLVKLLDAGERLPVHLHPEGAFARTRLGVPHGKAEAWYILEGGSVHLGFRREVSEDELARWVETQDVKTMVAAMHTVDVGPGDSVYVAPGMPHAIGAGIFLVEVQEPEDLSILLEWKGFAIDGRQDGHLGLGFPAALLAADRRKWTAAGIEGLIVRSGAGPGMLVPDAGRYFRLERHSVDDSAMLDAGFSVLIVLDGEGSATTTQGSTFHLRRGDTMLLPHEAGDVTLHGKLTLVRCRPPAPQ